MSGNRAWSGKTGGGKFGQRALLFLFRGCDVRVGYAILTVVIPFYLIFARKGYRAMRDYFRDRHGLRGVRNLRMVYRNHYRFGQVILDRFSLFAGRKSRFRVELEGMEHYERLAGERAGFVMAGSHAGNFEIAGYLLKPANKLQYAVVFGGESAFVQAHRGRLFGGNNIRMIPVAPDMSHLFEIRAALDAGDIVSMPCDRINGSTKSFRCELLGAPAPFPAGPFMLAAQTGVEMVAVFVMKEPRMRYRFLIRPLAVDRGRYTSPREIARALAVEYAARLGEVLRQYPEQWFNYYAFWQEEIKQ